MKKIFVLLFILLNLLTACGASPTGTPVAVPTVTEPPKTLIPTRESDQPPAPASEAVFVTTRAGQTLQFQFIHMEANEYVAFHTEAMANGIPLENGVEVAFKYTAQVDFDPPSAGWEAGTPLATWPVTLTLTDGTHLARSLGFKAHHQIHVTGDSNYGYVDIHLEDVQKIVLLRTGTPSPIPTEPPTGEALTVETRNGDQTVITYPKIFTICMYEVYCCHNDDLTALPLTSGDLSLADLQSVDFSGPEALRITRLDGNSLTAQLRPSTSCPTTSWRLRGKAALGDFEIELASVKSIRH